MIVGKVIKPHGLGGAVVIEVISDWSERFSAGSSFSIETTKNRLVTAVVLSVNPGKSARGLRIHFSGFNSIEDAETIRGGLIYIDESELSDLGDGEYWVHDLVGMAVFADSGEKLGRVEDVNCAAAQDLLSIHLETGGQLLIPFVSEFILGVDVEKREITVKVIEGMI